MKPQYHFGQFVGTCIEVRRRNVKHFAQAGECQIVGSMLPPLVLAEIEALIRRYKDSKDTETCWARYLLVKYLLTQRERLRELRGER